MLERKFIGHREWRLADLFSGDHRAIVIPDLQRDYCWGDDIHTNERKNLVRDFINNLLELYQPSDKTVAVHEDFSLGLIYGYEQPSDQIQLCDGQQRITTLFLLIGMLNRHLGDDSLKRYLLSEYEENDDREPYLRYSIRETSLYFMSDLVCRYFIHDKNADWPIATAKIPQCEWYYNDYDRDPSICSMCKALTIIETEITNRSDIDWRDFSKFLLNHLTFLYCDMETRENGEETFVVINTTGEPLSAAQNLKPKIAFARINSCQKDLVDKWEEMESWFWVHRGNGNDTSDVGFGEFLRWVTLFHHIERKNDDAVFSILETGAYTFHIYEVPFSTIFSNFTSLRNLYEKHANADDALVDKDYLSNGKRGLLDLVDLYKLLPVIQYIERFADASDIDIRRVFRYFDNVSRYQGKEITKENRSLTLAVRLINAMPSKDVVSFLKCKEVSKHILPDEERRKLQILSKAGNRREEIEKAFWDAQNFRMFDGEIMPLIDWASAEVGTFSFEKFSAYAATVRNRIETNDDSRLDLIRRALLAYNLEGYPVRDGKNLSFCGEDWQWKKVVFANSSAIKAFVDELMSGVDVNAIIKRCRKSDKWYEIAHYACALAYCEYKNVQEDVTEGIILIKRQRATTWFKLNLLKETQVRFGADRIIGIDRGGVHEIGFTRIINGHTRYLQRWLSPAKGEADLYLMKDEGRDSYIPIGNGYGKNDLLNYRCISVPEEMKADEIAHEIESLILKCSESDFCRGIN